MSMSYIRKFYGVPARRGARIEYTEGNAVVITGVIRSARGAYLRVMPDGFNASITLHPTWNVKYL